MVSWSALRPLLTNTISKVFTNSASAVSKRCMSGHHTFPYQPTRWQWIKFKDFIHLYVMVGAIPVTAIILYANIFIGPATLCEIPPGYTPCHWEYYRNPITRFMAKYLLNPPQQDYEKYLHHIFEEEEKMRIRILEKKIKAKMAERNDYQAYYYRPVNAKYLRLTKKAAEDLSETRGE